MTINNKTKNLILQLPTGYMENLPVLSSTSVLLVKTTIEKLYGIPAELLTLLHNGISLKNEQDFQAINDATITLLISIDSSWSELIEIVLKGDMTDIQHLASSQLDKEDRMYKVFVMLFTSATQGFPASIISILSLNKDFDLNTATQLTGRTLLHAAINSGSLKCVEEIKKFASLKFEQLLYIKDNEGLTPIACLTTNNLRMLNYINKFVSKPLTLQDVRESTPDEMKTSSSSEEDIRENTPDEVITSSNEPVSTGRSKGVQKTPLERPAPTEEQMIMSEDDKKVYESDKELSSNSSSSDAENKENKTKQNGKIENKENSMETAKRPKTPEPTSPTSSKDGNISLPSLSRPKAMNGKYVLKSGAIKQTGGKSPRIFTVSPVTVEKNTNGKSLTVGKPLKLNNNKGDNNSKLPQIQKNKTSSPRKVSSNGLKVPSFGRHPHPPNIQKGKKPVAGVLKESSARKFSAAQFRQQPSTPENNHHHSPHSPRPPRRPASTEPGQNRDKADVSPTPPRPATAASMESIKQTTSHTMVDAKSPKEKVRRISRIQTPHRHQDENGNETEESLPKVIEIEKDRMEKPWNNWMKAGTVDAESNEAKTLSETNPNRVEQQQQQKQQQKSRKTSLQVPNTATEKTRKKSFDQWVLYKAQMEIAELQRLRDENKHHEANEAEKRWKHGKTFEQWKAEKEAYDKMLTKQQEEDKKENKPLRKYLKGKTYEQWQRETEEHDRMERETRKALQAIEKEQRETSQQKRRKESTAKYEQWLLQKEMAEIEREMQARQSVAKRKSSAASKPAGVERWKSRRRSTTM